MIVVNREKALHISRIYLNIILIIIIIAHALYLYMYKTPTCYVLRFHVQLHLQYKSPKDGRGGCCCDCRLIQGVGFLLRAVFPLCTSSCDSLKQPAFGYLFSLILIDSTSVRSFLQNLLMSDFYNYSFSLMKGQVRVFVFFQCQHNYLHQAYCLRSSCNFLFHLQYFTTCVFVRFIGVVAFVFVSLVVVVRMEMKGPSLKVCPMIFSKLH